MTDRRDSAYFFSGSTLIAASLVPQHLIGLVAIFVVMAKFCITMSFNLIIQISGELFPTVLRVTGCGFAQTCGRIMSSTAPFIAYSATAFTELPTLIMGGMALLGGIVAAFLPETMNRPLAETEEDSKHYTGFGIRALMKNITCQCWKHKKEEKWMDEGIEMEVPA